MALDDYLQTEVGVAAAATAIALSPKVRHGIRRGVVLGVGGVMKAADAVRSVASEATGHESHQNGGATAPAAPATTAKGRSRAVSQA